MGLHKIHKQHPYVIVSTVRTIITRDLLVSLMYVRVYSVYYVIISKKILVLIR